MTDLRGIELKENDVVLVISVGRGSFSTREAMVVGFTPQNVRVKFFPHQWEIEHIARYPTYEKNLTTLKLPNYLILK